MNIGNHGYSSWIHNTAPQAGYGSENRSSKTGADKTFPMGNKENDKDVINDAGADTETKKAKEQDEQKEEGKKTEDMTCREQILAHMQEMVKKVREGKVEPTFQTGGQTFTIKEWDKLLADFDDAEEALQEQIKELIAEVEKQAAKEALRREAEGKPDSDGAKTVVTNVSVPMPATAQAGGSVANPQPSAGDSVANPQPSAGGSVANPRPSAGGSVVNSQSSTGSSEVNTQEDLEEIASLLTDEVTKCSYPGEDPKNKHWFITCYGQDGISCKEAYMENGKWVNRDCWSLSYTEPGQYEKVLAFLQRFPQDANLRFASHENFWKDFLAGGIDEDDFVNFFETSTKDGVPDYTYEKDGSTYIDREKAKYAKYMNDFGAHFYTAEEMDLIWRGIIHENRKGLKKLSDYDGQMTVPGAGETREKGKEKDAVDDSDDLATQIITKPDGSTVLQIETNFGMTEIEITEARKFGLQYNARPGSLADGARFTSPFVNGMENG